MQKSCLFWYLPKNKTKKG